MGGTGVFIWVIGLIGFLIWAGIGAYQLVKLYKIKNSGVFAAGIIVGTETKSDFIRSMSAPMNQQPKLVYPVVEFTDTSGNAVRARSLSRKMLNANGNYDDVTEVGVIYNPSNPQEFIVADDKFFFEQAWSSFIIGLIFAVIMAVIIYIQMKY